MYKTLAILSAFFLLINYVAIAIDYSTLFYGIMNPNSTQHNKIGHTNYYQNQLIKSKQRQNHFKYRNQNIKQYSNFRNKN